MTKSWAQRVSRVSVGRSLEDPGTGAGPYMKVLPPRLSDFARAELRLHLHPHLHPHPQTHPHFPLALTLRELGRDGLQAVLAHDFAVRAAKVAHEDDGLCSAGDGMLDGWEGGDDTLETGRRWNVGTRRRWAGVVRRFL